ncbi:hypothetical protein GP5015_968 [gamma proteobacterium HTCC5015]|nr:hypothetical protein GP5015_968 [gamma proteobacterium HTCC5015]
MCSAVWSKESQNADSHPPQPCYGPIESLQFEGEKRSHPDYLRDVVNLPLGSDCDSHTLEQARQALMDTELFRSVRAHSNPSAGGTSITYTVAEKFYWIPLPRITRSSDGEIGLGGQLKAYHLWGRNHTLDFTSEVSRKDEGQGNKTYTHEIDYLAPRLINSNFGFSLGALWKDSERDLYVGPSVVGEANTEDQGGSVRLIHWLSEQRAEERLRISYSYRWNEREFELTQGASGGQTGGSATEFSVGLHWSDVHYTEYRRTGRQAQAIGTLSRQALSSDSNHEHLLLIWREYKALDWLYLDNLNTQVVLGYSSNNHYGVEPFSLGGSDFLRGLEDNSDHGYNLFQANIQYLSALKPTPTLRWGGFVDIGNVFDRHHYDLADIEYSLGASLRWKVRWLVRTDIRLDAGYHPQSNTGKVYLGTNALF